MRKYLFSFLLLIGTAAAFGQKKSVVNLISSERTEGTKRNGIDVIKVYKGVFQQDYSTLRSDSAYFYQQANAFDAFGHVNINQGDTLNIYSDKLNYNGNTKIALLTDNVRMVDKDATLTTNYLTYNTATRIGTYTGGGKLVNKTNTLTSKNGYYFAFTRDAYFRYDVLLTTPDALIKTDTLRYNSGSRVAYFYGPTNIYGKKDKDTLYTENGTYNTITEQSFFGKKNLYKQGTKSLKGDSLFYDRLKGFGRALKHITFNDNEQKITLKGDLGEYYKADERTLVTRNAYVIMVTEQKDTTSHKHPVSRKDAVPVKPAAAISKPQKMPALPLPSAPADKNKLAEKKVVAKDTTAKVTRDSIYMSADTLETRILTYKNLKLLQQKHNQLNNHDTSKIKTASIFYKKPPKVLTAYKPAFPVDTSYQRHDLFGKPKLEAPVLAAGTKKNTKTLKSQPSRPDSLKKLKTDPVYATTKVVLSDTSRIRILSASHRAKLFKSDLQAKADSMFYSTSDSTIRCYIHPIIWTQGSQLSGDTVNMQMKNKKLDNMELYPSAFIVNVEKGDSTHYNQVAGKKMRGFFRDNRLQRMFVDGNAESIYFSRDSAKNTINGMQRSLSSRMRIDFKDNKAQNLTFMGKPENRYGPLEKFKEDERILKGFIWKPKERPVSKESIIFAGVYHKPAAVKKTGKSAVNNKTAVKNKARAKTTPQIKASADSSSHKTPPDNTMRVQQRKDTVNNKPGVKSAVKP